MFEICVPDRCPVQPPEREDTHTYQSLEKPLPSQYWEERSQKRCIQRASLEILQNNKVAIATRTMAKTLWYNPLHSRRDASLPDPNNSLLSAQTMETMSSCGNSFPKGGTQRDGHRHREESFFFHFALEDSTRNQASASTETYWDRFSSSKQLPPHRGHLAAAAATLYSKQTSNHYKACCGSASESVSSHTSRNNPSSRLLTGRRREHQSYGESLQEEWSTWTRQRLKDDPLSSSSSSFYSESSFSSLLSLSVFLGCLQF